MTGQGISDALRDAELLADAIAAGLQGEAQLDVALTEYERARNTAVTPMYDFTLEIAEMGPPKLEQLLLFEALQGDAEQTRRFFGVLTGAVPVGDYLSPGNLRKLIGLRGFAKIARSKLRPGRPAVAAAARL